MFSERLKAFEKKGLLRSIRDREPRHGALSHIHFNGERYINFASNDYLGLAASKHLTDAAADALVEFGFGAGASRLLSGGTRLHCELETAVASFKGTEAALLFNSGYTANMSVLPSISGEGDIIFSDELNHASLIDACRLSKAQKVIYRHADAAHLGELIENAEGKRKIVVSDTVFSMEGDVAPLKDIVAICKENDALLYVDDAHGTGVLGNGRGAMAHYCIRPEPWIIQMGTFSKALGSYGAFVAAGAGIIEWLINTARGLIFSTALPSCVIAASLKALRIVESGAHKQEFVAKLWRNRERLFDGLHALGLNTLRSETPIIPIVAGDVNKTMEISRALLDRRIYCPAIRPPTVTLPRLRVTVTAAHSESDIDTLLGVLKEMRL